VLRERIDRQAALIVLLEIMLRAVNAGLRMRRRELFIEFRLCSRASSRPIFLQSHTGPSPRPVT
jgi:hypothetical protein